jgi:hypothetical protein
MTDEQIVVVGKQLAAIEATINQFIATTIANNPTFEAADILQIIVGCVLAQPQADELIGGGAGPP